MQEIKRCLQKIRSKKLSVLLLTGGLTCLFSILTFADASNSPLPLQPLSHETLADQLGWVPNTDNMCGGYYFDQPFVYPIKVEKDSTVAITGDYGLLSQRATSILEGKVTVTRTGQQITTNKAFIYRDPVSGKLSVMDMVGNVHLREPNTLIVANKGRYNFNDKSKSLINLLYRTSLTNNRQIVGPNVPKEEFQHTREITTLTAWGEAHEFQQDKPKIYELSNATYSTCPPINPTWQVKASHITLNKNTGRGYASHARIYLKNIPIFYMPYINFSIDGRRKSGFLWPTFGGSNNWGPYVLAPFYWNMAPNYDMIITPGFLSKRGVQLSDHFRYITKTNNAELGFSVLPEDRAFADFKRSEDSKYSNSPSMITQAELNRLRSDSMTRKGFYWHDRGRYNDHWSSSLDINYAGDDYYLKDFGSNLNEISQNQLLEEADLFYKSRHWDFTGRMQMYQTLHPIEDPPVNNVYRRFPQLILNGDYPDQKFGLEYFINNEVTHFELLKTPGTTIHYPIGNRFHVQPGISLPLYWPYFYVNPRLQLALTQYQLQQTTDTLTPNSIDRAVPIFDTVFGLAFDRNINFFGHAYQQTLEPQVYYTYIPFRDQADIPIFDTVVGILTYDQLFSYNRFNGLDRIGDANQIAMGVTTRLIDQESGLEKLRLGLGGIVYFANRRVTQCNTLTCTDNPFNPELERRVSPISGTLTYNINPAWNLAGNSIWNPITKQLDNATIALQYTPAPQHVINFAFTYARGGDIADPSSGIATTDDSNNLKATTASFAWPVIGNFSAVGLWTQNWNHEHLQNLLYGLQYDSCCWTVRFVGGRAFAGLTSNSNVGATDNNSNKPLYNTAYYIQFSLKGLGDIGTGNPSQLLSSINGYNTQFGQDLK